MAFLDYSGYNPNQYLDDNSTRNLLSQFPGGSLNQTITQGPNAPPPQNLIRQNGVDMNAGLLQTLANQYGNPFMHQIAGQDVANATINRDPMEVLGRSQVNRSNPLLNQYKQQLIASNSLGGWLGPRPTNPLSQAPSLFDNNFSGMSANPIQNYGFQNTPNLAVLPNVQAPQGPAPSTVAPQAAPVAAQPQAPTIPYSPSYQYNNPADMALPRNNTGIGNRYGGTRNQFSDIPRFSVPTPPSQNPIRNPFNTPVSSSY